jgi:mannose-1-phosphate guanylyltransferase
MNKNLYVVLMAGGVGVRFWPYSRNSRPKQFLDVLGSGRTLLQSTVDRLAPLCPAENIFIITHEEHVALVRDQLSQLPEGQILAEPMRKNTAPCIAYATYKIRKRNPEAVVIVSPADHLILKEEEFRQTLQKAVEKAQGQDKLITLGIQPNRPETGYGYIQYVPSRNLIKKVKTFTEKPELSLAKTFLQSGEFVWNSGIFIWGVRALHDSLQEHMPELAEVFSEAEPSLDSAAESESIRKAYAQCKSISIDYGIMEKASNVYVILGDFTWSDLGSWGSLHEASVKDENNNAVNAQALIYDSRNCVIRGSEDRLIVVQGLNGYLVGEFGDVVIVCEKDREELFRRMVNDLKSKSGGSEFL